MTKIENLKQLLNKHLRSDGPFTPIDVHYSKFVGHYIVAFVDQANKPIKLPKQTIVDFRYSSSARFLPTHKLA